MAPPLNGEVGIDRDDADGFAGAPPVQRQAIHKRGFACARRTGDADDMRAASRWVDRAQQLARGRAASLGDRDAARQGAPVAGEERVCQFHVYPNAED